MIHKPIVYRWCTSKCWSFSTFDKSFFFRIDHWCCCVVGNISNDSKIWLYTVCHHLSTLESDFFLYSIDDIQSKRKFFLVVMQQFCNLSDHKSSCTIIQCTTHTITIIEDKELIIIGDDVSDMYSHFFNFFFTLCSYIQCDIFYFWCIFFVSSASMDSRSSKDSFYWSFVCPDINSLGWSD